MKARIAFQSPEQNVRWPQNFSLRAGIRADKQNFIIRGNSHGFCFARRFFPELAVLWVSDPARLTKVRALPKWKKQKLHFWFCVCKSEGPENKSISFCIWICKSNKSKNERHWKSSFGFCFANQHIKHGFLHFCLARVFPATFLNFGHQAALQFEQLVDAKCRNPSHSEISVFFFQNGESKHCFCFYGQNRKNYLKKRCFQSKESMILEISP